MIWTAGSRPPFCTLGPDQRTALYHSTGHRWVRQAQGPVVLWDTTASLASAAITSCCCWGGGGCSWGSGDSRLQALQPYVVSRMPTGGYPNIFKEEKSLCHLQQPIPKITIEANIPMKGENTKALAGKVLLGQSWKLSTLIPLPRAPACGLM